MLFAFHPASFHPPFIIPRLPSPPSTGGDKSHRQGQREIIQDQLVTNRTEEIWRLSRLIKCMLRQTREGDRLLNVRMAIISERKDSFKETEL